jgi:hypothetical protein
MSTTISFASVCLVLSSCWQEGDAAGGGHVASLPCNTNIGYHQRRHGSSGRRPLISQPPGQPCTHFRFSSGQHNPAVQDWIWSHDARPQDLRTRIRWFEETHRKHDRRYANLSARVFDRGLSCHLHKYEWACRNRRPAPLLWTQAASTVAARAQTAGRERTHLRTGALRLSSVS